MDEAFRATLVLMIACLHHPVVDEHDAVLSISSLIHWLTAGCKVKGWIEEVAAANIITKGDYRADGDPSTAII